jgi:hypothetical protein
VPENYFENLPNRIQQRCLEQYGTAKKSQATPFWQLIRAQLSLAAGFVVMAIIAFAGYYFLRPTPQPSETTGNDYIQIVQKDIYEFDEGENANDQKDAEKDNLKDEMFKYLNEDNNDYVTLMEKY